MPLSAVRNRVAALVGPLLWLTAGCGAGMPIERGSAPHTEHAHFGRACGCAVEAAAAHLSHAAAALNGTASHQLRRARFVDCNAALTGIARVDLPPPPVAARSRLPLSELIGSLHVGSPNVSLSFNEQAELRLRCVASPMPADREAYRRRLAHLHQRMAALTGVAASPRAAGKARDARIRELIRRMRLLGAAYREAVLASQACHASALAVAVDAGLRGSRGIGSRGIGSGGIGSRGIEGATAAERALVATMTAAAAGADRYVAAATAIAALLDTAVRARQRTELIVAIASQLAAAASSDSLLSDAERPWTDAARVVGAFRSSRPASERRRLRARRRRPLAISSTPTIAKLAQRRQHDRAIAATTMLTALSGSDLGAVMSGASPLHGDRSPASVALLSVARAQAGDLAGALRYARLLVPLDSEVARMLARAQTAMEPSRDTATAMEPSRETAAVQR